MNEPQGRDETYQAAVSGDDDDNSMLLAPPAKPSAAVLAPRPRPVDVAVKLLWIKVALSVVGAVTAVLERGAVRRQLEGGSYTPSELDTAVKLTIAGSIFLAVVGAILWGLNAVFVGRGASWARNFATVLAVLGLLGTLFSLANQATAVSRVLTVGSAVVSVAALSLM